LQSKVVIFFLLFIFYGCSVSKLEKRNNSNNYLEKSKLINIESIVKQNITNESFKIQKCEIELISGDRKEKFIASVKFQKPDSFLISLRSGTGIEAARMFITSDTVIINDRFNKIILYGSDFDLKKKYGFNVEILPLLFGDLIIDRINKINELSCIDIKKIDASLGGFKVSYTVNCDKGKVILISAENEFNTKNLNLKFENFKSIQGYLLPMKAEITGLESFDNLIIKFNKIDRVLNEKIVFVPGKNYRLVPIK